MGPRTLQVTWLCVLVLEAFGCPDACARCALTPADQCEECRVGWQLHQHTCVDVDECDGEPGRCPSSSYCVNTEGSFKCRDCDQACVGCMGSGAARCRKCAAGFRMTGAKCLDVDECSDLVLACPGLNEICINTAGSYHCQCAEGFIAKDKACVKKQLPGVEEKGLFEDIQEDEVEVLQQMFFGVVLCALATLAAKGDLVYTSVFVGAAAGMAGYWLSDRGHRLLDNLVKR
ncbi:protein disulfide isomerase Creld1 [Synchiropus splendidus]|uniref:protein disulfide isomerase Creld1 n=1 Tax=Synchiropus splendidus TaxID=270530 RepID=UPI00237E2A91|nr:protein disulfide isomerase Creld1 [Synchiropus splendidus]XP_053724857.1 protein disulfide isomerase Creld1 [Synchiropus splendidus]